ncbi:hypothetical protein [Boseongicola sp. H5]|uniref:hypothetical protein n=1 Tax=Boseongicola sp. H5 TaxID=2763261 RepID=UPI001D0A3C44|nr:hypothetical protein [Boseongicola sp. H5]
MSVQTFVEQSTYAEKYKKVVTTFRGSSHSLDIKLPKEELDVKLANQVRRFASGDNANLDYVRLRTLADFLEISDSAVLMFCMLMSIERRAKKEPERILASMEFLDAIEAATDAARKLLSDSEGSDETFATTEHETESKDENNIWAANVDSLRPFVDAYKGVDKPTLTMLLARE